MSTTPDPGISEVNVTSAQRWQQLEQLNREWLGALLPALTLLVLVAVLGLVGNALVLHVYGSKLRAGTTRCFVLSLALVDLITCTIGTAGEISLLRFNFNFEIDVLCRLITFVKGSTIITSGCIIVFMTIERYRRLCWITRRPMGEREARRMVVGACVLGGLTAAPYLFLSGTEPKATRWPDIYATECVTAHSRHSPTLLQTYAALLLILFIVSFATLIGLYVRIALTVWRRRFVSTNGRGSPCLQDPDRAQGQTMGCSSGRGERSCLGCGLLCCFGEKGCPRSGDLCCCFFPGNRMRGRPGKVRETPSNEAFPHSMSSDASSRPSSGDLDRGMEIPMQLSDLSVPFSNGAAPCADIGRRSVLEVTLPGRLLLGSSGTEADVDLQPSAHDVIGKIQAAADSRASQPGYDKGRQQRNRRQSGVTSLEIHNDDDASQLGNNEGRQPINRHPLRVTSPEILSDGDAGVGGHAKPAELGSMASAVPPAPPVQADVDSSSEAVVSTRRTSGRGGRRDTCESGTPSSGGARGGKTTRIIVVIGLAFILCYLPFLLAALVRDVRRDLDDSLAANPVYNLFLRSYFALAAVNPFVYGFLNVTFRTECKKLFSRRRRR